MDPKGVLEELKAIGVFEKPEPSKALEILREADITESDDPDEAASESSNGSELGELAADPGLPLPLLEQAIQHTAGLLHAVRHVAGLLQTLKEMQRALGGSVSHSDPVVQKNLPLQPSPGSAYDHGSAYAEARQRALAKIRGEYDVVPDAPVTTPVRRDSLNSVHSPEIVMGSPQSRVLPSDPSEFVSIGRG